MTPKKQLNWKRRSSARTIHDSERGQMMIMIALMMMATLGVTAFVIDVGRVSLSYHQLQASTDAAALAAGEALGQPGSTSTSTNAAGILYSSQSSDKNTFGSMSGVIATVTPYCSTTLENSTTSPVPCLGAGSYNAVKVTQTVSVPTTFAALFGTKTVPLSATATAAMYGAPTTPYNVAIILDATLSQASTDDNCGTNVTEMTCELEGVQVLLQNLLPCATQTSNCSISNGVSTNSVDRVALFTFPALTVGTASVDTSCPTAITAQGAWTNGYQYDPTYGYYSMVPETAWSGIPTATSYSFPTVGATSYSPATSPSTTPTYQVTPFLSDYRISDTATTLNTGTSGVPASLLVKAIGGVSGCSGMLPPNFDGDIGTYYAGVIYAAQSALVAEQSANPGSQNVIILLSDGDATAPQSDDFYGTTVYPMPSPATSNGTYPSWNNECHQAITAAQYAANQGTRIYAIAYGSENSGCASDSPGITPCSTMQNIASSASYFFSDYAQSGSGIDQNCIGTGATTTNLQKIFQDVYVSLSNARLIPNGTS